MNEEPWPEVLLDLHEEEVVLKCLPLSLCVCVNLTNVGDFGTSSGVDTEMG